MKKSPADLDTLDLITVPRHQLVIEICLPLPWLGLSLWLYSGAYWPIGMLASFLCFLGCLRLNHEAIRGNPGLSRRWNGVILHVLRGLRLGSNPADAFCHLPHHRDMTGPDDCEGHCAKMTFGQVPVHGPRFPVEINRAAWTQGSRFWRRRIVIDRLCVAGFVGGAALIGQGFQGLHGAAMALGQCLTAQFAVSATHHGTAGPGLAGRCQRGVVARRAYLMFYTNGLDD